MLYKPFHTQFWHNFRLFSGQIHIVIIFAILLKNFENFEKKIKNWEKSHFIYDLKLTNDFERFWSALTSPALDTLNGFVSPFLDRVQN